MAIYPAEVTLMHDITMVFSATGAVDASSDQSCTSV